MSATLRAALLAALALLAVPGQALADSIAFVKGENVWLISPDGSSERQVTTDGTASKHYAFPSQADDGTILAKFGEDVVRLRPDGSKIGGAVPMLGSDVAHSGNLFVMAGPASPRISPDGTRFAYWISARSLVTCPIWDPGCSYQDTDYTIVSHVDRFTAPEELKAVRDYRDPSWAGNDRLLVFNHGLLVKQGALSTVGAGEPGLQPWFGPPGGLPQVSAGELSRQGDKLAALAGSSAMGLSQEYGMLYGVSGYPAEPEPKCYLSDAAKPSSRFMQPSWSPDGTQLALTESDGIHVFSNIPDLRAEQPDCGAITERLLVYGSEPGWGPADVPAAAAPAGPSGGAAPTAPAGTPATPAAPLGRLTVAPRQSGTTVRVRVRVTVAGSAVRVRLLRGKRVLGTTLERRAKAGPLTLRVPLNRRGRAALRRTGRLALKTRITVTPPNGTPSSKVRRVVLTR